MSRRTVYFGGAIRGDRTAASIFPLLITFIRDELHIPVLTEHVAANDPREALAKKIGKTRETMGAEDVEQQDIAWLDTATDAVFEISGASTGTGREVEYARTKGLLGKTPTRVLVLYHVDHAQSASPMVIGMTPERYPNVAVRSYATSGEAKEIIRSFLAS